MNIKTGDIAWKVPLGVTDELSEGRKNTGPLNLGAVPITFQGKKRQAVRRDHGLRPSALDPMPEGSEALVVFALP